MCIRDIITISQVDTKGGITMKYSNGNTKETGYHSVDSAEDALGDILS